MKVIVGRVLYLAAVITILSTGVWLIRNHEAHRGACEVSPNFYLKGTALECAQVQR